MYAHIDKNFVRKIQWVIKFLLTLIFIILIIHSLSINIFKLFGDCETEAFDFFY